MGIIKFTLHFGKLKGGEHCEVGNFTPLPTNFLEGILTLLEISWKNTGGKKETVRASIERISSEEFPDAPSRNQVPRR